VRDLLFTEDPEGGDAVRMVLSNLLRAIWFNDLKLARRVFAMLIYCSGTY